MPVFNDYPKVPQTVRNDVSYLRLVMQAVNRLLDGHSNNTGEFTCTDSADSTVVPNKLCTPNAVVLITPTTADAALEWTSGSMYIVAGTEQFEIFHDNNALTDRVFKYAIVG